MVKFTIVVFAFLVNQISLKAETNISVYKPDFAYPQTVINNAEVLLDDALNEGNSIDVVKALLQIVIAKNQISKSNLIEMVELVDSVAKSQPVDIQAILYSIEAELYYSVYLTDSYQYNQRNVSKENIPVDPTMWDTDIFALRISELVAKSLSDKDSLLNSPITEYQEILEPLSEENKIFYSSLYDLLAYRGLEMLSEFTSSQLVIHLFDISGENELKELLTDNINEILSVLKTEHLERGEIAPYIIAVLNSYSQFKSGDIDYIKYLIEEYNRTKQYDCSMELLINIIVLSSDEDGKYEYYRTLKNQLDKFPCYVRKDVIKSFIDNMDIPEIELCVDGEMSSKTPIRISGLIRNMESVYLQIYAKPEDSSASSIAEILPNSELVKTIRYEFTKEKPFYVEIDTLISDLECGHYFIVPANGPTIKDVSTLVVDHYCRSFQITDMIGFTTICWDNNKESVKRVYVVDSHTGRPIKNAIVRLTKRNDDRDYFFETKTNGNGYAELLCKLPESFSVQVSKGKDRIKFYSYSQEPYEGKLINIVSIHTDLAIYKPGNTVNFSVIAYSSESNKRTLLKGRKMNVLLRNVNNESIDTLSVETDSFGRASGSFVLPKNGLKGRCSLEIEEFFGGTSFFVEEYKAQSFFIKLDDIKSNYAESDTIRISGSVKTYSGMPIANADVKISLGLNLYGRAFSNSTYTLNAKTDLNGCFYIELFAKDMNEDVYRSFAYMLTVTATSETGEYVESSQRLFCIGKGYRIDVQNELNVFVENECIEIPVKVVDMLNKEVAEELKYTIFCEEDTNIKYEGVFVSPTLHLNVENIPSGKYGIKISMANNTLILPVESKLIIQRDEDARPPFATPLWLPKNEIIAEKNAKYVEVKVGSTYNDSWILCEIVCNSGCVSRKWLRVDNEYKKIKVEVPQNDNITVLHFITVREGQLHRGACNLYPASINDELTIKVETFRDKITPQNNETWKFRFEFANQPKPFVPVIATMSDKALNALTPFKWNFNEYEKQRYLNNWNNAYFRQYETKYFYMFGEYLNQTNLIITVPKINLYGENLYGERIRVRGYGSLKNSGGEVVYAAVEKFDQTVVAEGNNGLYGNNANVSASQEIKNEDFIEYRPSECPSAFFYPSLMSDENGVVEVCFEVPDYSTTWQFQMLGYTDEMYSKLFVADAVSSKPIMVKSNLPRFLRMGDKTVLQSTFYNKTEESKTIAGKIELFDPLTNEIFLTEDIVAKEVSPMGSRVVEIEFSVDKIMQFVGYRVYALSGDFSDGEQELIAILPSSSSVIESVPFYMGVKQSEFSYILPEFNADAKVTFSYCENPIWYCVTALPEFQNPQSSNINALINAYFVNCMARGLVNAYPQIRESITEWKSNSDSILISNLQKNEELKNVLLENTPWVQDAKTETLRMQNLASLFDYPTNDERNDEILKNILALQADNGGWRWCQSMSVSEYMTNRVLYRFAMLKDRGYVSDYNLIKDNIKRAVLFCDNSHVESYKKYHQYDLPYLLSYLYVRSRFDVPIGNDDFEGLKQTVIADIKANWRKLSKYYQATAAMVLYGENNQKLSREILESLNQNAMQSPERGMWFDNLSGSYDLLTTKQVLLAYNLIDPDSENIDKLRQWLIMQRQAQNWGTIDNVIEVVYAILSTGMQWFDIDEKTIVAIGDEQVMTFVNKENSVGQIVVSLDAEEVGGEILRISRTSNQPAWGGIISQQVLAMQDVKAVEISDLSIDKKVYKVIESSGGTHLVSADTLGIGDKVRVQLMIDCDKDMEYVSIIDQRAACMSPIEQLSHYVCQDGIWAYREVGNDNTNIFIEHLSKGSYILTYDCVVSQAGNYSIGIATAQSSYAPELVSHSSGGLLFVR